MKSVNQVEDRLLAEAKQLATPGQRRAFLQTACGENLQLRQRLEAALGDFGQAAETDDSCAVVSTCSDASSPARPVATRQSGDRIGHYLVIRRQAAGGMGEVYLAQDTRLGRLVALKFLPEEAARDAARRLRFFSEARAAAALNHPNICTVYDVAETDDALPYIAMEWLEGPTLRERLTGAPLPIAELLQIGLQVAEALDAAHARGIVHRDLKPANVSLMPGGLVKVLDFGLAKWQELALPDDARSTASKAPTGQERGAGATTASLTATGQIMGSLGHMSPEQATGRPVDHRSDLFSLGVLLYEMATGRLPFAAGSRAEILQRTVAGEPESLVRFNDQVPAELERIVTKSLRKDPGERYQSAGDLHTDLLELRARLALPGAAIPGQVITLLYLEVPEAVSLKQAGRLQDAAELMRQQEARFQKLVNGQTRVEATADAFLMEFGRASESVQAALRMISETGVTCRFGIHFGEVTEPQQAEPLGRYAVHFETVVRLARLAGPGHVLMSRGVFDNARGGIKRVDAAGLGGLSWVSHGQYVFEGMDEPLEVCEVSLAGPTAPAPPPTTEKVRRLTTAEGDTVLGWRPAVGQEVPNTRWVLEEKLGEGGFGEVWKARHEKLEESRVFKFCFRADRVRSLKREVTLFRVLKERIGDHPNIVRLHDLYFDQPPFYLEEEYVAGRDLRTWCEAQGGVDKVPLEVRLEIVAQAADALQAAHDAGVIHRDVKPGNILIGSQLLAAPKPGEGGLVAPQANEAGPVAPKLAECGSTPLSRRSQTKADQLVVKLTDFGIGQVTSEEVLKQISCAGFTQTLMSPGSSHGGTQLYMAPELSAGKPASTRSDTYSLGVVLYQLLIGDFSQAVTIHWAKRVIDPLLREDLDRCLAGEPKDRYPGAAELAENIRALSQRRAELAARELAQRRSARRQQMVVWAGGVVGLLLLLAFALGYGLRQAQNERERLRVHAYASDISVADIALREGDLGKAHRVLRQHIPKRGQTDLRGIEWCYLWQQTQGDADASFPHPSDVQAADVSPDGRWIATTCSDNKVRIWEVKTRRVVQQFDNPYALEKGSRISFSPDGRWFVAEEPRGLGVWETSGWRLERLLLCTNAVVSFSGDGSTLAALGWEGLQVWKTERWEEMLPAGELDVVRGSMRGGAGASLALSRDGGKLAVAFTHVKPGTGLWDLKSRSLVANLDTNGWWGASSLAVSRDNRWLAAGSWSGRIRVWDFDSCQLAADFRVGRVVFGLSFSADGNLVAAAGGADQVISLWQSGTTNQVGALRGHLGGVTSLRHSSDGKWLISGSADGTAKLWKVLPAAASGQTFVLGTNCWLLGISSNGSLICTLNHENGVYQEFALSGFSPTRTITLQSIKTTVLGIPTYCPLPAFERRLLFAGTHDGRVRVYSLDTGEIISSPKLAEKIVVPTRLSPDGRFLFAAERTPPGGNLGILWNLPENRCEARFPDFQNADAYVAFSPDGRWLAYPATNQQVNLWDIASKGVRAVFRGHKSHLFSVEFSPDGRRLAAACWDSRTLVWDVASGGLSIPPLEGHRAGVHAAFFSPDGQTLQTMADDGRIKLWCLATGQEMLSRRRGPLGPLEPSVALFSSDGSLFFDNEEGGPRLKFTRLHSLAEIDAEEKAKGQLH